MLPVASNSLPTYSPAGTAASQHVSVQGANDATAASRQLLPNAVVSTAAPAAYFPGTPQWRQAQFAERPMARVNVPPPTGDYILVQDVPAPPPPPRPSTPVTLGIPLTTQLTAQFMAQQPVTAANTEAGDFPEAEEKSEPTSTKKEVPFAAARGTKAYSYAVQRSAGMTTNPEVEAV